MDNLDVYGSAYSYKLECSILSSGYTTLIKGLELQSHTKYIEADGNTANCAQPTACDRACARAQLSPLTCVSGVSPLIYQRPPLTAGNFFATRLNIYIFIRSVNFSEGKCSLDSELSEFEEIFVIGDIGLYLILERSATYSSYLCNVFYKSSDPSI